MAFSVEVYTKPTHSILPLLTKRFSGLAQKKLKQVWSADSYVIDAKLSAAELKHIARLLTNDTLEVYGVNRARPQGARFPSCQWVIEIGFLPGVTDNVGTTAVETICDALHKKFGPGESVYTSRIFFIQGIATRTDMERVALALTNPLIQRTHIWSAAEYARLGRRSVVTPKVKLKPGRVHQTVSLNVSDEELARIGKQGIANSDGTRRGPLALSLPYMQAIQAYFKKKKRNPTDIELESLAQTWSEHCKHTIFRDPIDEVQDGLFKHYIRRATQEIRARKGVRDFCVSVFTDNSGGIAFDEDYLVTHKVETHNSPSALDPFGGAVTGIVGVNRDALGFGLGAKPVINTYGFCVGLPDDTRVLFRDAAHSQRMLSPRRILDGVVAGVNTGGNCSGIPTAQGFLSFDERYRGKPLVFVGTVGLIPRKTAGKLSHKKSARPGDYIVMIGGRVGLDGIHGATFSSESLNIGSPSTAVQIGDPITQKKLSDALVREARDRNLYTSITDNGAGGLSCSVAEMAKESGGCEVHLDTVPTKYPGLEAWQIWISESQERMTLAVPPAKWKAFNTLMHSRGVEATVVGRFTKSGQCVVKWKGKTLMDIDLEFLHEGLPTRQLLTESYTQTHPEPSPVAEKNLTPFVRDLLRSPNIASFSYISRQYDHEVQGGSVLKPLQGRGGVNADAGVVRPVLSSSRAVVLSTGMYPNYADIDAYAMAAAGIDTALRNAVVGGASLNHLALLDNFCWCSPGEPRRLYQLKRAAQACYDLALAFGTPFISGKDSMYNDFNGFDEHGPVKISIPPTLLISAIGVAPKAERCVSLDLKTSGDGLYILGETHDELGGSEHYALQARATGGEAIGNQVPQVNANLNLRVYRVLETVLAKGLVNAALGVGHGGLVATLVRMSLGGLHGVEVTLEKIPGSATTAEQFLFSESQGRVVVAVPARHRRAFETAVKAVPHARIGEVGKRAAIHIRHRGTTAVDLPLSEALNIYRQPFANF